MSEKPVSRQVRWARKKRDLILSVLGGKCVFCGITTNLTFDCIRATGDRHHRLSSVARVTYYVEQMRRGNLQVLCHSCNSKKGAGSQPPYLPSFRICPKMTAVSDSNLKSSQPHLQGSGAGLDACN
jgi:hypothetical protein